MQSEVQSFRSWRPGIVSIGLILCALMLCGCNNDYGQFSFPPADAAAETSSDEESETSAASDAGAPVEERSGPPDK